MGRTKAIPGASFRKETIGGRWHNRRTNLIEIHKHLHSAMPFGLPFQMSHDRRNEPGFPISR